MDWQPIYSVGNETLDRQHLGLFAIIDELQAHLQASSPDAGVRECLGRLLHYADEHFSLEESMMAEASYGGLAEHRYQHDALRERLGEMSNRFAAGDPTVREDLFFLLVSDWLASHILGADHGYAETLRGHFRPTA